MSTSTICAISTPAGCGGIAIVRLSGPRAIEIADCVWLGRPLHDTPSHTARLGSVVDARGELLDQPLATVFRAPASFTGEDVVEFSVHGSRYIQQSLIDALLAAGAEAAGPGEFTKRAFVNGKLDLAQAEAVADIIAAESRAAHRIASQQMRGKFSQRLAELRDSLLELATLLELELDFSEEDVEFADRARLIAISESINCETTRLYNSFQGGQAIKDGIPVAIVGAPNAGKSSILNTLLGDDRAIVSDIPGTTRDTVEDTVRLGDYTFRLIDTAGIRHTSDTVERIGIERSHRAMENARIVIAVSDVTTPLDSDILQSATTVLDSDHPGYLIHALNKSDLIAEPSTLAAANDFAASLQRANTTSSDNFLDNSNKFTANFAAPPKNTNFTSSEDAYKGANQASLITDSKRNGHVMTVEVSTVTADGAKALRDALLAVADADAGHTDGDALIITNARHAELLRQASESSRRIIDELRSDIPSPFVAQSVRETIHHLSAITGSISSQDILSNIFRNFCIGK